MNTADTELTRREFVIGNCIGRGGFGEVYRAKMTSSGGLEADVAVKVLRNDVDPGGQALERLRDEGKLLSRLNHPAILRVHDLVILDGCVSLVAEYVDGQDMAECMDGDDALTVRGAVECVAAVASALDAAYNSPGPDGKALRLVHRDIKPANVRISRHGVVKLLDFGIAKSKDTTLTREAKTATNMIVGSPGYMAPERFLDSEVHAASDVFALGCILYETLAGQRFFGDLPIPVQTGLAVSPDRYQQHLEKQLRRVAKDAPAGIVALVTEALAYDPADRPTAAQFASRCEEHAESAPGLSLGRWARARRWPESDPVDGPLQHRTLTEGTMARPKSGTSGAAGGASAAPAAPTPPVSAVNTASSDGPSRMPWVIAGVAVMLLVLVGGGATMALLGGGMAAFFYSGASSSPGKIDPNDAIADAPPAAQDAPADGVAADAHLDAPPTDEAATDVVPVDDAPVDGAPVDVPAARVTPRPPPRPADPPPATVTAPTPPVSSAGKVHVDLTMKGNVTARLVGDKGSVDLPGDVEPGGYKIEARFAEGEPILFGAVVNVEAGVPLVVQCDTVSVRCKAVRK